MYFKQFYLGCLAHASYLIGDSGEAAVVDPQRDVGRFLAAAEARGATIRQVLETHLHNDYVSGAIEIREATGASIAAPANGGYEFPVEPMTPLSATEYLASYYEESSWTDEMKERVAAIVNLLPIVLNAADLRAIFPKMFLPAQLIEVPCPA